MRAGRGAGRQVERADQAFLAHFLAGDAVGRQALGEAGDALRAGGARHDFGDQRLGDRVVEVLAAGRVHGRLRPDQAHGRDAAVVARDGRVAAQVDHAVLARDEGGLALPEHAVAAGEGGDLHRLAGRDVLHPDLAGHVDERVGGLDAQGRNHDAPLTCPSPW